MPSFKRPIGASGVLLALALVAGACASDSSDSTAAGSSAGTDTPSADAGTQPDDATSEGDTDAEPEADPAQEAEGPSPVAPHSFPDLNTVTISDGAPVNLADELAGGDTPILLWFFAPH